MVIADLFTAGAAVEIRMDHAADDRAGPDDRDFDHQVVKACAAASAAASPSGRGFRPGTRRSCRPAAASRRPRDRRRADARRSTSTPSCRRTSGSACFKHRQHPESEQINLDNAEVGAVFLVPLDDHPPGHRGGFERDDFIQRARRRSPSRRYAGRDGAAGSGCDSPVRLACAMRGASGSTPPWRNSAVNSSC